MAVPAAVAVLLMMTFAGVAPLLGDGLPEPVSDDEQLIAPSAPGGNAVTAPTSKGDGAQAPASEAPDIWTGTLDPDNAIPWAPTDEIHGLAHGIANSDMDPDAIRELLVEQLYRNGFPVAPPASMQPNPPSEPHFEPNDTLMFSHNLGDADEDGFDDVAINALCVTYWCFYKPPKGATQSVPPRSGEGATDCGTSQQLYAKSGRTGDLLWDIDLSKESLDIAVNNTDGIHDYIFCPVHIVMGTIPVGPQTMDLADGELPPTGARNGSALLVYTIGGLFGDMPPAGAFGVAPAATGNPTALILEHSVYAFDSMTGQRLWTHTEEGLVAMWDGCAVTSGRTCTELGTGGTGAISGDRHNSKIVHAENLLVNPLMMIPRDQGVSVHSNATPSLYLQGVSFDYEVIMVWASAPGNTKGTRVIDYYRPNEWVGELDLNSGAKEWAAPTFTPEDGRSVVPKIINAVTPGIPFTFFTGYQYEARTPDPWNFVYGSGTAYETDIITKNYWRQSLCCFDISGDGIPDLVYSTQEWNSEQYQNEEGPHALDSRVVAFSGVDGSRLWGHFIAEDVPRYVQDEFDTIDAYSVAMEVVGDTDGDGIDDVLVNKYYLHEDFLHEAEVRSGANGAMLWGVRSAQHKVALPLGDADGDGGVDIAMFDWFDWDFPVVKTYHLANVTAHAIKVRSGADGSLLWETESFNAPLDLFYILDGYKVSGLNDLNGDGVGDFSVDDPTLLPDQTLVHYLDFKNGADGSTLYKMRTIGTFAFPVWAGDQDMDGIDEFFIFNGEIGDIWVTNYDGASGNPVWSQRFMTMNANDYTLAVPRIGVLGLTSEDGAAPLINYQMRIQRFGGFIFNEATYPQIRSFHADGVRGWNYPALGEPWLYEPVLGASPAAQLFDEVLHEHSQNSLANAYEDWDKPIWKGVVPSLAAFLVMFFVGFRLGESRRKRRRAQDGGNAEW